MAESNVVPLFKPGDYLPNPQLSHAEQGVLQWMYEGTKEWPSNMLPTKVRAGIYSITRKLLENGVDLQMIWRVACAANVRYSWPRVVDDDLHVDIQAGIDDHNEDAPFRTFEEQPNIFAEPSKLHFEMFDSVEPDLNQVALVEDYLEPGAMSVLYGESNSGKTFFAMDIAFHVALGRPWMNRDVMPGAVVYVAAEGGKGVKKRVAAFKKHHDVSGLPFALVPCPIDLLNPEADTQALIDLIANAAKQTGKPVVLVVVDTLARAIAGGNENASEDMGAFVRNVDRVRQACGAHTMIVHHSGKNKAAGARGHSSLRAATDTEIEIDQRVATATKQRDLEQGLPIGFDLQPVNLGATGAGKVVTSCVVLPRSLAVAALDEPAADSLPAKGLAELRRLAPKHGAGGVPKSRWVAACTWVPKKNKARMFDRMIQTLIECGHVVKTLPGNYQPTAKDAFQVQLSVE